MTAGSSFPPAKAPDRPVQVPGRPVSSRHRRPVRTTRTRNCRRNPQDTHVLQVKISIGDEPRENGAAMQHCDIRLGVAGDAPQPPRSLPEGTFVFLRWRDPANGRHDLATVIAVSSESDALDQQRGGQIVRHRDDRVSGRLEPAGPCGGQGKLFKAGARRRFQDMREGALIPRDVGESRPWLCVPPQPLDRDVRDYSSSNVFLKGARPYRPVRRRGCRFPGESSNRTR